MKRAFKHPFIKGLTFALVTCVLLAILRSVNLFSITLQNLEYITYDWRVRNFHSSLILKHARYRDQVKLVKIDADSFHALKASRNMRWPWNRRVFAELVTNLTEAGARVIAFDVFFAEHSTHTLDPGQDQALADAVRGSGRVILAESRDDPLVPQLEGTGLDLAFIEHVRDTDAITRRSRLQATGGVDARFSLAFAAAMHYRGQTAADVVRVKDEAGRLRALVLPPVMEKEGKRLTLAHPRVEVPVDAAGTMLVNFIGDDYFGEELSAYEVLLKKDLWRVKGRVVMIGATARDLHDDFPTPVSIDQPTGTMAGVKIHNCALATVLEGRFIRNTPWWFDRLLELVAVLPLAVVISTAGARLSVLLSVGSAFGVLLLGVALFYFSWVSPIISPALGVLILFIMVMAYRYVVEESEKRFIKSIFKQYVTEEVVEEILANPEELLKLGGDLRPVTILFADIRNFTSLSESLPPEEVVELLNDFFERMTAVIEEYGGTLDKYLGDGFMVLFGAPVHRHVPAIAAVRCALAMQRESERFIDDRLAAGKRPPEGVGIGINSGEAVVGNIGSQKHKEYTAIGRVVNLSARIVAVAPSEHTYISDTTRELVGDTFNLSSPMMESFKGIDEDSKVFAVLGEKKDKGEGKGD